MKVWIFYGQLPKTEKWVLLGQIISSENLARAFIEDNILNFEKIYPLLIEVPHPDLMAESGGKK